MESLVCNGEMEVKQKHALGVGDLRSHLGSVSKLWDLVPGPSPPPELTSKMKELNLLAPKFLFRSKLLGYLSLPDSQSWLRFGT